MRRKSLLLGKMVCMRAELLLKMSRIIARAKSVTWVYVCVYGGMAEGKRIFKKGMRLT
jgi:hypothetical protein